MDEEQLKVVFRNMAEKFVKQLQTELTKKRLHSPGFKGNAYSEGRNPRFKVNKPTSLLGKGGLVDSIEVEESEDGYSITMDDHWQNVVTGLDPQKTKKYLKGKGTGTSPFIEALKKWARSRGIDEGAAFGIRRNIWKYGIKPFNFIASAEDAVLDQLEDELEEELFEYIEEVFDEVITTQRRRQF